MKWRVIGVMLAACGVEWFVYTMAHPLDHSDLIGVNLALWPTLGLIGLGTYCFVNLGDD